MLGLSGGELVHARGETLRLDDVGGAGVRFRGDQRVGGRVGGAPVSGQLSGDADGEAAALVGPHSDTWPVSCLSCLSSRSGSFHVFTYCGPPQHTHSLNCSFA